MEEEIVLYSNNCPKCKVVKKVLDEKDITYRVVSDMNEIMKFAESIYASSLPILVIGEEFFVGVQAVEKSRDLIHG